MNEIEVFVSPNLELINGILLTSRYNELTRPYVGYGLMTEEENDYTFAVKAFFKPYRAHKIYKVLEAMIPNGFTFSRPVELALAFDESGDFPYLLCALLTAAGLSRFGNLPPCFGNWRKKADILIFFKRRPFFIRPISKRPAKPSAPVRSSQCWKPNSGRGSTPTVMWSPR